MQKIHLHNIVFVLLAILALLSCQKNGKQNPQSSTQGVDSTQKIEVKAQTIIDQIKEGKHIRISNAVIVGDLNFTAQLSPEQVERVGRLRIDLPVSLAFANCTFEGNVIAYRGDRIEDELIVAFNKNVIFQQVTFNGKVMMRNAHFEGSANFSDCTFNEEAAFQGISFHYPYTLLAGNTFNKSVGFQNCWFAGDLNLLKSKFYEKASFQNSTFNGRVQLGGAEFVERVDFGQCRTLGPFLCNNARFQKQAVFSHSSYFDRAEWSECKFFDHADYKSAHFTGPVSFSESLFTTAFVLDNSHFMLGMPDTSGVQLDSAVVIDTHNTFFYQRQKF